MQNLVNMVEPKLLWNYFLTLSQIPRPSKQEAKAAAWCLAEGRTLGLETYQDAIGNVIIRKAASPGKEDHPIVCLQAHLDMVCQQADGVNHDFTKDPIHVLRDGDFIKAKGTSLGADNGIGVAACLAVLASQDISHGPLEVLLTVDEEDTMAGAENLDNHLLRARYLLNLDTEVEGELIIGSAGGIDINCKRRLQWVSPMGGNPYCLKINGLQGGHSGVDIHRHQANAIRLLANTLYAIQKNLPFELGPIQGGQGRSNCIPQKASAIVFLDPHQEKTFRILLQQQERHWQSVFGAFDPGITLTLEPATAKMAMSPKDASDTLAALLMIPTGVESMSHSVPGLVQTSTNLGVVQTRGDELEIHTMTRSAIDASKYALADRITAAMAITGFHYEMMNDFPGWTPNPDSTLVTIMKSNYQKLFNKSLKVLALHGGLECSFICNKYPSIEIISFGTSLYHIHTPEEKVSISATQKFWTLLKETLESL